MRRRGLAVGLICAGVSAGAPAAVGTDEPIAFRLQFTGTGLPPSSCRGVSEGEVAFRREPAYGDGEVARRALRVGPAESNFVGFAWDKAKGKLYLDTDRDLDLTDETPLAELNLVRFRLAYLYWMSQDFYRAAVMGEFLATHYPQSMGARQGAEIAIKAYRTLYALSPRRKEERTFETRRMTEIAKFITTRWAGQPEAGEAWMMLLDTAVDNRDLEAAQECLANIDPESPRRAEAELRTGQALWAFLHWRRRISSREFRTMAGWLAGSARTLIRQLS